MASELIEKLFQTRLLFLNILLNTVIRPNLKNFHIGHGNYGDPDSFSVPHFHDKVIEYLDPKSTDGGQLTREEAY